MLGVWLLLQNHLTEKAHILFMRRSQISLNFVLCFLNVFLDCCYKVILFYYLWLFIWILCLNRFAANKSWVLYLCTRVFHQGCIQSTAHDCIALKYIWRTAVSSFSPHMLPSQSLFETECLIDIFFDFCFNLLPHRSTDTAIYYLTGRFHSAHWVRGR